MTATAVSLTMVTLRSESVHNTRAATSIMTSAVLDDVPSLALVAILVPLASGGAMMSIAGIALLAIKALAFFALISIMGIRLFPIEDGPFRKFPLLNSLSLRRLITMNDGEHATLTVRLLALLVALLGYEFGFHPAVGAYMAGLILKEEYFVIGDHTADSDIAIHQGTRRIIDSIAFSWIGPVLFIVLGTHLVINVDVPLSVIDETLVLLVGLFFRQILSAGLAARFTGGFA
jgi:Kef-type K+ transport system membrane component KefB